MPPSKVRVGVDAVLVLGAAVLGGLVLARWGEGPRDLPHLRASVLELRWSLRGLALAFGLRTFVLPLPDALGRGLDALARLSAPEDSWRRRIVVAAALLAPVTAGLAVVDARVPPGPEALFVETTTLVIPWGERARIFQGMLLDFVLGGLLLAVLFGSLSAGLARLPGGFWKKGSHSGLLGLAALGGVAATTMRSLNDLLPNLPWGPLPWLDAGLSGALCLVILGVLPQALLFGPRSRILVPVALTGITLACFARVSAMEGHYHRNSALVAPTQVVLITIDTLRADRMGLYGNPRNTTPGLDRLAEGATVFERAFTPITHTEPAHTSLLTGTLPRRHGTTRNGQRLGSTDLPSLQAWFGARGFATAAITSKLTLGSEVLGWEPFDYENRPKSETWRDGWSNRSWLTLERARRWLTAHKHRSYFLWVHFWDPHWYYSAPDAPDLRGEATGEGSPRFQTIDQPAFVHQCSAVLAPDCPPYTAAQRTHLTARYDAEVAYTDYFATELIRMVEENPPETGRAPLVVITSDHGETLDERLDQHNYGYGHGHLLTPGSLRVPLIVRWRGVLEGGNRVDALVSTIDVAPTLVELIDPKASFGSDGDSLAPLLRGVAQEPRSTFVGQRPDFVSPNGLQVPFDYPPPGLSHPERAVVQDQWFLVHNPHRGAELYDLRTDPEGRNDVADDHPDHVAALLRHLDPAQQSDGETPEGSEPVPAALSPSDKEVLRSLGYVGSTDAP